MTSAYLRLALHPDRLVDDEGDPALAVGAGVAVGLGHGADKRAAVAVVHLHVRVARGRVVVLVELRLDRRAAEPLAVPREAFVVHRLRDAQARHGLAFGGVLRIAERAAVRPHAVGQLLAGGGAGRVAGDAALGVAGEEEAGSNGTPLVVDQMLLPGLPRPCMAASAIIARPLVAAGGAAGAAPTAHAAGGKHGLLAAPLAGEGADLPSGDAALALGPLRRLRARCRSCRGRSLPIHESQECARRRTACRSVPSASHVCAMARPSATSVPGRGASHLSANSWAVGLW